MDLPDREAAPHFSQPVRQVVLMLAVIGLSGLGAFLALPSVLPVFESNPYLNGFILFVFVLGVLACFWQVVQLIYSVRWIERFTAKGDQGVRAEAPTMLAPLAALLGRRRDKRMQINTTSTRSILDSVATRIDEARDVTRYIVSLLIFLGLLGTFYGLATTVPALVETIQSLAPSEGESGVAVFGRLMTGLESQLGGMGVAFASSLLGLACSLVVGLLELFAGHGQNRFYRELEEWLSSITKLGFSSDTEGPDLGAAGIVLDQMAEQMERLQSLFVESQQGRAEVDERLAQLADSVERLTERIEATAPSAASLARIADGQENLADAIRSKESTEGLDAESRMRLRSIDVQMLRILEEISAGRQESMAELRTDIATLTRALGVTRNTRPRGEG
ncbi:motA/TolQ/ExbB proton channel family protein [Ponticoccus alexandrii]|uniref:Biopolymer transporter ExbB n=1 Tax=Ponticoccus alexandrii TaxID=1943633 RepID=A0ABX7FEJ7_9RHOB|nr:motA/TolQ/ExbB proton channel family protein [Ponticoccus alexandrii]ETA51832.1 biopolymer transporter ExbB [Rhodobacteraceae bacterium PD-2]QRF68019.1 biopolymer transporter ExbB [Ponticoccus alexandrii]